MFEKEQRRLVVLASVVLLAGVSVNCTNSSERANSTSPLAPSVFDADASGVSALARKGSSITLVMDTDINENGTPDWGDTVTFTFSTTATTEPHIDLTCSQNRAVVYGATTGFYPGYPWPWTQFMTLSSTAWKSGEAYCTAKLYSLSGRRTTVLASISFTAGA